MKILRAGLIGYGFSGEIFHAPFIKALEGYELSKVVSSNPTKVHNHFPEVEVIESVDELLADELIDLVIITTPNTTHHSIAKKALLAGKHVVVEKPFVNQAKDAEELIELAANSQKIITVFQNRRWDNDFLTVKQCIESGALGEIFTFESHFDRFRPQVTERWREQDLEGSGILYDLGAHLIDQALQLFGLPETIQGDVQVQRNDGLVDDYFHIVLGYGKLRVILHSSCIVMSVGPRFQVHGNKGSFVKYGMDSQEAALKTGKIPGTLEWGWDSEDSYGALNIRKDEIDVLSKVETIPGSYQSFYQELYHSIVDAGAVPVDAVDAMNTIKVIEAVKASSLEKRTLLFT
ncbi:oxidoreductase [Paenibacillus psychroresistens]|uniref:Oxidoreductase n=1 Tax=Paenibacillus psychroresistens TaxID=1778678 RepID=A0A6B8RIZ2_9BACL|nr:oxidoreductase [Paenibacillus psychroresistens]QGQ95356.1 oxidoreductase [Paenibacillus psychroresistens]